MGWLFTQGQTKAELITHLTEMDSRLRTHRKCVRGNVLWAIQENIEQPEHGRFIVAYLMQTDPGYGWGYKPVAESMGPAELSCPVRYLDEVPVADGPYAMEWRQRVRKHHAVKKRQRRMVSAASAGDLITLVDGVQHQTLIVASKQPLIGTADDGSRWRVPQRFIESIEAR